MMSSRRSKPESVGPQGMPILEARIAQFVREVDQALADLRSRKQSSLARSGSTASAKSNPERASARLLQVEDAARRLSRTVRAEHANAAEWERRAMLAVKANDDDLAREALSRKRHHAELATTYQTEVAALEVMVAEGRQILAIASEPKPR